VPSNLPFPIIYYTLTPGGVTLRSLPHAHPQKILCALIWLVLAGAIVALVVFVTPPLTKHVIIPILRYLSSKLSKPALVAVCAAMVVFLPMVFLPWRAAVWLAAWALGFGWGFLLATLASTVGMALPFLLARHGLHDRVARWAGRREWYRTLVLAVKEAGPARTVLLMRLGPAPYALLNYAAALAPTVPFWTYLGASVVGHIPDTCVHLSVGAAAKGLAAAIEGSSEPPKAATIVRYVLPIVASIAIAVAGTIYCKRALASIREQAVPEGAGGSESSSESEGEEGVGGAAAAVVPAPPQPDVELGRGGGSGRVAPAS
jgi:uncharacterized membrane protein YdjX (TVP38/TMEM64 family)